MYILHRLAEFVGGQYTGQTRPQKVNLLNYYHTLYN